MYRVFILSELDDFVREIIIQSNARYVEYPTYEKLAKRVKEGDLFLKVNTRLFSQRMYVCIVSNGQWETLYTEEIKNGCCGGSDPNSTFHRIPFERLMCSYSSLPVVLEGVEMEMVKDEQ